jgi:transposase
VRITSLLRQLIDLKDLIVTGVDVDDLGVVVDVRPSYRIVRCSDCGRKVWSIYDRRPDRRWRHLDLAGMTLHLRYEIRRVSCRHCGVRVEQVPWADAGSWFTRAFEDQVAFLAQRCDKTTVSNQARVSWSTVGSIVQRVVARYGRADALDQLTTIGVDELSYRRHHEYVTVVVDHTRGVVVWAKRGKSAETLKAFFDELGPERCKKLEAVTIDMSGAYIKAVTEATPNALLVFDRFHVQRLAHNALDEVRRAEVRAAAPEDKRELKGTRWPLQKNPWNLTSAENGKLVDLQRTNQRIYRAYLLKEELLEILDHYGENLAELKLGEWMRWAKHSGLEPFAKLAKTIQTHLGGILAYVRTRLSNGRTEGLNGKARTLTRRSFGFHAADSLIAMLKLCCGGINLHPIFSYPRRPTKPA